MTGLLTIGADPKAKRLDAELKKLRRLGSLGRPEDVALRKCLYCGEPFASAHLGNRLCRSCKHASIF